MIHERDVDLPIRREERTRSYPTRKNARIASPCGKVARSCHLLGLLKPDIAAFTHVADMLEVPAGRVLFLDDNAVNIAGAAAAAFQAARAAGVEEARQRLVEAAVLGTVA